MWKIGRHWINPQAITFVHDCEDGKLVIYFRRADEYLMFEDEERQALLAYLAQHSTMHPPYLVRDDSDEIPF